MTDVITIDGYDPNQGIIGPHLYARQAAATDFSCAVRTLNLLLQRFISFKVA